jgi:GNAT superfamily N-acetyltransferase
MDIGVFRDEQFESVADLLLDMSIHYNGENASSREVVRHNLRANILGPRSSVRLVIAAQQNKVIALAAISILYPAPKEKGQLFMKELYVLSSERGRGVGKAIMKWTARYAVVNDCVRFDWTVDSPNKAALAFYQQLGAHQLAEKLYFRIDGEQLIRFSESES